MPFASIKSIREVSSEDCNHLAENLLKQTGKSWKTKSVGERLAYVILELTEPHTITGVDIGNEHSAFIEVLVGKASCSNNNFTEILVTCSFMTPIESKNSTNVNRVRCFSKEALVSTAAVQKWQFIKVVCTQPFNKHVQYGISFIKLHVSECAAKKEKLISDFRNSTICATNNSSGSKILFQPGKFNLREDSPESDSESSTALFQRWKSSQVLDIKNTKSNPFQQEITHGNEHTANRDITAKLKPFIKSIEQSENVKIKCLDRNREEIGFGADEDEDVDATTLRKRQRLTERIEFERENMQNSQKSENRKQEKKLSASHAEHADGRPSNKNTGLKLKAAKENNSKSVMKTTRLRPFNLLMDGVVLVISGIQNPERSNLRDMALAMGAKYRTEWGRGCTHLICAFKNTPKYNQVKGNGKIVTRAWIEDCHAKQKYIPWRRYALDSGELNQPESDDEILDETLNSVELSRIKHHSQNVDVYPCTSLHTPCSKTSNGDKMRIGSSGSDTDDDIERVLRKNADKANESVTSTKDNVFDVSTQEEDFLSTKMDMDDNLKNEAFLKGSNFYICEDLSFTEGKKIEMLINRYKGSCTQNAYEAQYLISNGHTPKTSLHSNGKLVKPAWLYECNDMEMKIPITKYLL